MLDLLFLVCFLPLAGFFALAFARARIAERGAAWIGVGTVGASAVLTALIGWQFLTQPPEGQVYTQVLWQWMAVGHFKADFALRLDALSLVMMGVITGVGFFIHLFAAWYMRDDEGFDRFFSYMNLFVASMLFLVLGDNLMFLYLGWEGVGLSSYLLIGFWYKEAVNGAAARKAFVVTRVGDTFMAVGLLILFNELGTLNIQEVMARAAEQWEVGAPLATLCALLILGGAVGKSAQLPLQTWLPDAMAGPTPVSALIHAATMVVAGVYLVARTHVLFELSPFALECVGWVGALTALLAGFTALTQTDIKRVLAYSTMSQIGYMFLALGAGAYQPAIFHLMTHAFFKALLFLSAGSVILALHHEQDIFKMGGLRKDLPFVFACFLIGSLALTAFPFTAGFYSKDEILWQAWATGHHGLAYAGLFGAFLTALYTFRLIFITFFGTPRHHGVEAGHGFTHTVPLAVLLFFSLIGGFIPVPLESVLPAARIPEDITHAKHGFEALSVTISVAGIVLAWLLFHARPQWAAILRERFGLLYRYWKAAWGFDWLYERLFTRPYLWFVDFNRNDGFDVAIGMIPTALRAAHGQLARTQTGRVRWYAAAMGAGLCVVFALVIFR